MTTNCNKFINNDIETAKRHWINFNPKLQPRHLRLTHLQRQSTLSNTSGFGRSPHDKRVECGGIWNKETGADYFTPTIRGYAFNANLGIVANQNDASLQAITPWGPKDAITKTSG